MLQFAFQRVKRDAKLGSGSDGFFEKVREFCIAAAAMSFGGRWAPWWKEERRQRKCFAGKARPWEAS